MPAKRNWDCNKTSEKNTSYDIKLVDPITKETLHAQSPHQITGGTYALEGTTELRLNITYNYWEHFQRVLGKDGIRSIYGKTGAETIPILQQVADQLADDVNENYWEPTPGNVKRALINLIVLAQMRPDGVWAGD